MATLLLLNGLNLDLALPGLAVPLVEIRPGDPLRAARIPPPKLLQRHRRGLPHRPRRHRNELALEAAARRLAAADA